MLSTSTPHDFFTEFCFDKFRSFNLQSRPLIQVRKFDFVQAYEKALKEINIIILLTVVHFNVWNAKAHGNSVVTGVV